jgi:hypothetical protein
MSWRSECRYMVPGIQVGFEINGEIVRRDDSRVVLRMRRTVARGLRERLPREIILAQTISAGKFEGSADLAPGVEIMNGKEIYFWTLTLWPSGPQNAAPRPKKSVHPRRRPAS